MLFLFLESFTGKLYTDIGDPSILGHVTSSINDHLWQRVHRAAPQGFGCLDEVLDDGVMYLEPVCNLLLLFALPREAKATAICTNLS